MRKNNRNGLRKVCTGSKGPTRIIARAHLRREAPRAEPAPSPGPGAGD